MKYKHIFWDWNGTLIDDLQTSIDSVNVTLAKRNLPLMNKERYFETFSFPVEEYYKKIGLDLEKENYEELAHEFIDNYNKRVHEAKLQKHSAEVIAKFAMYGIKQYILSASEKEILLKGLERYGIATFFTDIIALDNIYAEGKIDIAKTWFEENNFDQKALMIGDTYHDYEVATALGMDCILYAGGHGALKALYTIGVPVITDYHQLYDYVFDECTLKEINKAKVKPNIDQAFIENYKNFYDDQKIYSKIDHKCDW
ncbi:MAG: HAD family hydrolase [Clostridiales bacterium]|nr:HAD family hydrolase [Clostridiales bacterium]